MSRIEETPRAAVTLMLVAFVAMAVLVLARNPSLQRGLESVPPETGAGRIRTEALFPDAGPGDGEGTSAESAVDPRMARIRERFEQAVFMLHAGRYDDAATALHAVLLLSPRLVAAHVNMGYALLGLGRYKAAADFFRQAIDLDPYQGNAYWGLAEVLEAEGDLPGALGAMRTYIHLAKPGDPFVRRARSALWEWESRLEHGPPTPEAKAWMERRRREDEARNAPDRDAPDGGDPAERRIPVESPVVSDDRAAGAEKGP